jgi:aminocarboxymuconate-semialdehyde decarboxylase
MIIDCHAHLVSSDLLAAIRSNAARFPNVRQISDGGSVAFAFAGGKPTRPVSKPLSDIPARLTWMSKQGIDRQIVGGWVDMFGYELPGAETETGAASPSMFACCEKIGAAFAARDRAAERRRVQPTC